MSTSDPLPSPPLRSPLIRCTLGGAGEDLNAWLAAANGLACAFIIAALIPEAPATAFRIPDQAAPPAVVESITVNLEAAPSPPPAAASAPKPPSAVPPESGAMPPELPPSPWRELPAIIEPVPVIDPPPPPPSLPPRPVRPSSPPKPAAPRAAPGLPVGSTPGNTGRPGTISGTGTRPGAAPGGRSGNGLGLGTTPDPAYPAQARRDRIQGTVTISISVVDGEITSVRVLKSSGSALLDETTLSHVQRRWKWPAGTTQTFTRPITYRLSTR